jgi:ADP-glucose pyrophosphorylase
VTFNEHIVFAHDSPLPPPIVMIFPQISPDSLFGEGCKVAERANIKSCIVGKHCKIGPQVRLTNCILMHYVSIEEKYTLSILLLTTCSLRGDPSSENGFIGSTFIYPFLGVSTL